MLLNSKLTPSPTGRGRGATLLARLLRSWTRYCGAVWAAQSRSCAVCARPLRFIVHGALECSKETLAFEALSVRSQNAQHALCDGAGPGGDAPRPAAPLVDTILRGGLGGAEPELRGLRASAALHRSWSSRVQQGDPRIRSAQRPIAECPARLVPALLGVQTVGE